MFSFFKKPDYTEGTTHQETVDLLNSISRTSGLNKKISTITTKVVEIENAADFVEHFRTYLGNPLNAGNFIDVEPTKRLKHKAYKYIFAHHEFSEFISNYDEVIQKLKELKPKMAEKLNREIAVFHDYDSDIGAIRITLQDFWDMFPKILDVLDSELHHDLLIVSLSFSFGICVEIEGLDYSITTWGLDDRLHVHKLVRIEEEKSCKVDDIKLD